MQKQFETMNQLKGHAEPWQLTRALYESVFWTFRPRGLMLSLHSGNATILVQSVNSCLN